MQQNSVVSIIEQVAPPVFAAAWDKSGVQVASGRAEIGHLAVCLDPTPEMVQRALTLDGGGADMILAHHPLSMSPCYPDSLNSYHHVLSLLFSHDIPLYSAHTSLDGNPEGPAAWLPDELGLTGRMPLEQTGVLLRPGNSPLQGGFGCVGDLPSPLSSEQLFLRLAGLLPLDRVNPAATLAGTLSAKLARLAVCTGSGASLAGEARARGAQLLITGDLKYHAALDIVTLNSPEEGKYQARDASAPFAVLDVGHFALEEEMMRRLAQSLARAMPEVKVTFLPGRDPFRIFSLTSCH